MLPDDDLYNSAAPETSFDGKSTKVTMLEAKPRAVIGSMTRKISEHSVQ
jgi:hypothetical protein